MIFEDEKSTGQCEKCPEHCVSCEISSICDACEDGYLLSMQEGENYKKCILCPPNCLRCDGDTGNCLECNEGFVLELQTDGTSTGKCISCPDNCGFCESDAVTCTLCNNGFGFQHENGVSNGKCVSCSDTNCASCTFNNDICNFCKDEFCFDIATNSPNFGRCIPCNDETKCLVDGCQKCIYGMPNDCAQCNSNLELDRNNKCKEHVEELERPLLQRVYSLIKNTNNQEHCNVNVNDYPVTNESQVLTIRVNHDKDDDSQKLISRITIDNSRNSNLDFEITGSISELAFMVKPDTKNKNFAIIPSTGSHLKIGLDDSSFVSIKDAKGEVEITGNEGTKKVDLNEIQPSSQTFKLIPSVPLSIQEVDFNSKQGLLVQSKSNNDVEIKTIKVQQKAAGIIQNARITGDIIVGLSSSLEINQNVDLSGSKLDLSYDGSQGLYDKAPINGVIKSNPASITIRDRKLGVYLAQERFLIAESSQEFDCGNWKGIITSEVINRNLNEYVCVSENVNGRNVYRLYAQEKIDEPESNKLSKSVIIIIVVAVVAVVIVGVVVFLLVYFLVIKKRKTFSSVHENGGITDNNEDEGSNANL